MPNNNRFRHQQYTSNAPHSQYELISPTKLAEVDTPEFHGELNRARNVFAAAKVRAIYLIHGTFAGDDLLGLLGEWERYSPVKAKWWRSEFKRLVDAV